MNFYLTNLEAGSIAAIVFLNIPAIFIRIKATGNYSIDRIIDAIMEKYGINDRFLYRYMSLTYNHLKDQKYYTLVTYMFNHADVDHLICNMTMFVQTSSYILPIFGYYHWIMCFILGGIVSGLCAILEFNYKSYQFQQLGTNVELILNLINVPKFVTEAIKVGKSKLFDNINGYIPIVGASGGVSALTAFICCHYFFRYIKLLLQRVYFTNNRPIEESKRMKKPSSPLDDNVLLDKRHIIGHILSIFNAVNFFRATIIGLLIDIKDESSFWSGLTVFWNNKVSNSAHFGGILFGFFYYLIAKPKYI